jgi:hypothetical protein
VQWNQVLQFSFDEMVTAPVKDVNVGLFLLLSKISTDKMINPPHLGKRLR